MAYQALGIRKSKKKARHAAFRARMKTKKGGKVPNVLKKRRLKGRYNIAKKLKTWV